MVGTLSGTDLWFRRGAASTGLTDYGVGKDGTIYMWNHPLGTAPPGITVNRAGWANGGSDGLEGDGPLFVRTLGVNAINRDLISIERDDRGQPFTDPYVDPQALAIDRLIAHHFDRARVPWDRYPVNPNVGGGIVTDFFHAEFATKGCPWGPVMEQIDESQDRVRGLLKAAQTETGDGTPIPPPTPPEPDHDKLPEGYTEAGLDKRFGTLVRIALDGTESRSGFNMRGAISNAWIARGAEEGRPMDELPPAATMAEIENPKIQLGGRPATAAVVLFDGRGRDNWVLYRPDESIAWRWMF